MCIYSNLIVDDADSCDMLMSMSVKRLNQSLLALREFARWKKKDDIQTWLSAAITFQQTCKDLAGTGWGRGRLVQLSSKMDHLSQLTSNALAVINKIYSYHRGGSKGCGLADDDDEAEEGQLPSWVSPRDRKQLLEITTTTIKADGVVAQDGTGGTMKPFPRPSRLPLGNGL